MRKPIVLMLMLLVAGALPVLAGWDEGVAAFTKRDFNTAAQEFQGLVDQNPEGFTRFINQLGSFTNCINTLVRIF